MKSRGLRLEEVVFAQEEFQLELSLVFPPGKLTVVLGPSGSGKTTLLNLLAGFLSPQKGRIIQGDRDITQLRPPQRRVGVVFQDLSLFPHMTLLQNAAYGPLSRGKSRREAGARARELLALAGLEGMEHRRPGTLSGGEQQRTALARALASDPELMLLDEPFSSLDEALRQRLGQEVRRLQRATGVTTLVVTHDQKEALALADHLIIIKEGKLKQAGSPQELWERPANLFSALFLGRWGVLPVKGCRGGQKDPLEVQTPAGEVLFPPGSVCPPRGKVIIRSEDLPPAAKDAKGPGILKGTVTAAVYAGGEWRLTLQGGGIPQGGRLEMNAKEPLPLGSLVKGRLTPGRARLVPEEE